MHANHPFELEGFDCHQTELGGGLLRIYYSHRQIAISSLPEQIFCERQRRTARHGGLEESDIRSRLHKSDEKNSSAV